MLLLLWRVLLLRCLCVRTQMWEDLSYPVRNVQEEERQKFHSNRNEVPDWHWRQASTWAGILSCAVNQPLVTLVISNLAQFSLRKKPSIFPNIFVVRVQNLLQDPWSRVATLNSHLQHESSSNRFGLFFSWHTEPEPKPDSPALQAITTGRQS